MNFGVASNSAVTKATTHKYRIFILQTTVVQKTLPVPEFPHQQFATFGSIIDDSINDSFLVDVVGAVFNVRSLENTSYNQNDIDGFRIKFYIKDKDQRVLECVALKQEAVDFDLNYRLYGGGVLVAVLRWWKIYRYWDGPNNVRLCTHGPISKIYPNPNIEEVHEIREMLARVDEGNMENPIVANGNMG